MLVGVIITYWDAGRQAIGSLEVKAGMGLLGKHTAGKY